MSFRFSDFSASSPAQTATATKSSFDHGVEYPAMIVGLWTATNEYNGVAKGGVCILIAVEDNDNKIAFRTMYVPLGKIKDGQLEYGYVLGSNATYAKLMQGLLRCSDTDAELQKKIVDAKLENLSALVGLPCLARMSIKEYNGKKWANIDAIQGEVARAKGLDANSISVESLPPVDIQKLAGKFVTIQNADDCETIKGLRLVNDKAADDKAVDDNLL